MLGLRARNCTTGDILDDEQIQAARKEDVLNALSKMASNFRARVGESLATLRQHDTPLAEATTPSLEALKAYSASLRVGYSRGCAASVPFGRRAIEIDPKFAMAHSHLGRCYSNLGESVLAAESTTRAYELRGRVSDREKFYIALNYDRQVIGNLGKAQQIGKLWAQTYPRDAVAHGSLSGLIYQSSGKYEESIEEARKTIALDPDVAPAYVNLGFSYCYVGRLGEAGNVIQRASERNLETPDLLLLRYYIAFLKSDKAGMEEAAARARGRPGAEDYMSHSQALVLARSGQLKLAGKVSRRAADLAQQEGERERAATYETGVAVWEAFFGNASEARRSAMQALEVSKGRDVEYGAAFALALAGDLSRSRALADDLARRFPEDTSVKFSYLPVLRGLSALNHSEPSKAIAQLQAAANNELAVPGVGLFAFFGSLYPAYVRGEAYLALHQGAAAATEFQKLLDRRGIVLADPVGAIARLKLGRAFALSGDRNKARTAYRDFFTLWEDADADIPILRQAKAEYAKLQPPTAPEI
ncbi:MAG: hypothetical protein M3Y72_26140 [Acidobacteriota bacterium]|nr:hypothetical protein [Acidobacteriota bacterium]